MRRPLRLALLASSALTFLAVSELCPAHAQVTETYTGLAGDANFNTAGNYTPGHAPGSSDTVIYGDTNAVPASIQFGNQSTSVNTLSLTANSTNYTFTIGANQSFAPANISMTGGTTQTIVNNGTLGIGSINNSGGGTLALSGNGLTIASYADTGGGTLDLSGTGSNTVNIGAINSTGGTVQLNGATLNVGAASTYSSDAGTIADVNGLATLNKVGIQTFDIGTLAGLGSVNVLAGQLVVGSSNALSSANQVSVAPGATLAVTGTSGFAVSGLSDAGGGGGDVIVNAPLYLNGGTGNASFSGVISGSVGMEIDNNNGAFIQTLSGSNVYSGDTFIFYGNVAVGNNAAFGTSQVTFYNGILGVAAGTSTVTISNPTQLAAGFGDATFVAGPGQTLVYAGNISDGGSLAIGPDFALDGARGGAVVLSGNNTYSGPTTVLTGGTLVVTGTTSLPAASAVTVQQGGILAYNNTTDATIANAISGPGAFLKTGTGTLTLSGNNTYTGGTTVESGSLVLGSANALGTGPLTVDGGSVDFGGFAPMFTQTVVMSGGLQVGSASNPDATLNSPVTIDDGGTLSGHGTIIGTVTNNTGTVRPGGSIGTLTVDGNFAQSSSGTLAIEVNPTASSLLRVSGTARLGGTLAIMADPGTYAPGTPYAILTANGGVSGSFASTTESGQQVPFDEFYGPYAVALTVAAPQAKPKVTFAFSNLTPNEANATGAIESIISPGEQGAFAQGLTQLALASEAPSNRTALASVLGELRADAATVDLANLTSFNNSIVERMDRRQESPGMAEVNNGLSGLFASHGNIQLADNAMASDQPMFGQGGIVDVDAPNAWFHGYGVLGQTGGETGFADFQYQTGGLVAGIDTRVTDDALLGVAVAYEHTDFNLSGLGDNSQIDTYRLSLYGSDRLDSLGVPLTVDGAFGYAINDYHNNDFLAAGSGFSQQSRHDGSELTGLAGLSHHFAVEQDAVAGALSVTPRAGVEYDNIQQDAYTTSGASAAGLNLATNGSTLNALRSTLGARADLELKTGDGTVITPEVRATYLHDFMDTNAPLTEAFTGAPAAGFRITGVHPGREAALAGAGVTVGFSQSLSATIGYDAGVRDHELDHTVQAGIKYTW